MSPQRSMFTSNAKCAGKRGEDERGKQTLTLCIRRCGRLYNTVLKNWSARVSQLAVSALNFNTDFTVIFLLTTCSGCHTNAVHGGNRQSKDNL